MGDFIITKEVLHIYDKYDGDFGLLDEPWAKKDRSKVSLEQSMLLCEYVDKLQMVKVEVISSEMKKVFCGRINEIENVMDPEVAGILKKRFGTE